MNTYQTFWQAIAAAFDLTDNEAQSMALRLMAKGITTSEQWVNAGEVVA